MLVVQINNKMPVVIDHQNMHMARISLGTSPLSGGGVNSAGWGQ